LAANFKEFNENKISVVYDFSNLEYLEGYQKLMEQTFNNVKFYTDNHFGSLKQTLTELMRLENTYTMYLCDDIIMVNPFSLNDKEIQIINHEKDIMSTSLRLWEGIDFCYATNQKSPPPTFVKDFCWDWRFASGDWGYPMSCDGNIYLTSFFREKNNLISYTYPNNFEAALAARADQTKPLTACYLQEPKLINIPANVVQHIYPNRHGNLKTPDVLNELWLRGKRLDLEKYLNRKFNAVHIELQLKFEE
jgi:hypothetical protein